MRNQFRELHSALAVAGELERRPHQHILVAELKRFDLFRMRLTVAFREFRFVVKQIHLRRTAVLEQLNNRPGLRGEMAIARGEGVAERL